MVFEQKNESCKVIVELNPLENRKVERIMKKEMLQSKQATIIKMIREY